MTALRFLLAYLRFTIALLLLAVGALGVVVGCGFAVWRGVQ